MVDQEGKSSPYVAPAGVVLKLVSVVGSLLNETAATATERETRQRAYSSGTCALHEQSAVPWWLLYVMNPPLSGNGVRVLFRPKPPACDQAFQYKLGHGATMAYHTAIHAPSPMQQGFE